MKHGRETKPQVIALPLRLHVRHHRL